MEKSPDAVKLYPYQQEAVRWLENRKTGLLALDMGLGKSGIALCAALNTHTKSILVICPAIATGNWENEFQKWGVAKIPHLIVSYNQASKLGTQRFDLLIIDEAHFLKNLETQRTKTVFGKDGVVRRCERIWALTGTPATNHPGELWPLLYTFGATKLQYQLFVDRFCNVKTVRYGYKPIRTIQGTRKEHVNELKTILEKVMYRKTLSDVNLQLPSINYETITIPPAVVDWEREKVWAKFQVPVDRSKELFRILEKERDILAHVIQNTAGDDKKSAALTTLDQGVSNLRRYIGLQKVDAIATLITDELDAQLYPKIVVFAHHQSVIELLGKKLIQFNPLYLYGRIPPNKREDAIEKFERFSSYKVMICNIQTASTAINLTASNQILFVEQDWVPANNAQAAKRCHRIGQKKPVFVRFAAIEGSIDYQITETLRRKTKEIASFIRTDDHAEKIHPLEKLVEIPDFNPVDIDDKTAPSPDDIDALCQ